MIVKNLYLLLLALIHKQNSLSGFFLSAEKTQIMDQARDPIVRTFCVLRHIRVNTQVKPELAPQMICEHL